MTSIEIGIDEVGRGSIFGPVFSVVVKISKKNAYTLRNLGVDDSKKLSHKKRAKLFTQILALSEDWGIGQSSVREIDKYGIRFATELSMIRAIYKLKTPPYHLFVDGCLPIRIWNGKQTTIIKGDSQFTSIAAASIVAKFTRDLLMIRLGSKYNFYKVANNKGYGTKEHLIALRDKGLSKLHRKTFLNKLNII